MFSNSIDNENYSGILLSQIKNILIFNSSIFNNNNQYSLGSVFVYNAQNFTILSSNIYDNLQEHTGGLNLQQSDNIQILDSNIYNNQGSDSGGIYIYQCKFVFFNNTNFFNNNGFNDGGFGIVGSQNILISNLYINNNYAVFQSGGCYVQNVRNITYSNITLQNNYSILGGGMFFIRSPQAYFYNLQVYNNSADINGGGILFDGGENVFIYDSQFIENYSLANIGGAIVMLTLTNLQINNTLFQSGYAFQGGAGVSLNNSYGTILINYCKFFNNTSNIQGGALDFEVASADIQNCEFRFNVANEQGGAIIARRNDGMLNIQNCTFDQNFAQNYGGAIYIFRCESIIIQEANFIGGLSTYGGALLATDLQQVIVKDSQIYENQANLQGGGILVQDVEQFELENTDFLRNFVFFENQNEFQSGGGVYAIEIKSIIVKGCYFYKNQAYIKGGALYFENIIYLSLLDSHFTENSVKFIENQKRDDKPVQYHLTKGGAIYLQQNISNQSIINIQNSSFEKNKASSGSSIMILQENSENKITIKQFENIDISQDTVDIGVARYLGPQNNYFEKFFSQIQNNNGKNDLQVYDESIYMTHYYDNEKILSKYTYEFELCTQGSLLKGGGKTHCSICQTEGICQGGYKKNYPKKGYWRFDTSSYKYYECRHPEQSCLGMDQCKKGYKGILCEQCDYENGYRLTLFKHCKYCQDSKFKIISVIIFIYLAYICLLTYTTHKVMQRVEQTLIKKYMYKVWGKIVNHQNNSSQITKILIMHLQITQLIQPNYVTIPNFAQGLLKSLINPQASMSTNISCYQENLRSQLNDYQSQIWVLISGIQTLKLPMGVCINV